MKKIVLSFLGMSGCLVLSAQVPQGFNYQAIARDNSGNPIVNNSTLQVKLAVMSDSLGITVYWEELFNPVVTNAYGMFTVVMGRGTKQLTSTVNTFSDINWKVTPIFLRTQVFYQGTWKDMGTSRLWSVPYTLTTDHALKSDHALATDHALLADTALIANGIKGALSRLKVNGAAISLDSALFEVKNSTGQTIFGVYPQGVRIYVDAGVKGSKGGFAIGGFGTKAPSQPYLVVGHDSIRMYVDSSAMKGNKGGFAVGGFGTTKGLNENLFYLSKKNYFIGHQSGINTTTGLFNSFFGFQTGMNNVAGSDNVYIGYQAGLNCTASNNVLVGYQAGLNTTSGFNNIFLGYLSGYSTTTADNNIFIGSLSGYKNLTGYWNLFLGYQAGYSNTTGYYNSFIGNNAGYSNTTGRYNSYIGFDAGQNSATGSYNLYAGPFAGRGSAAASGSYNIFLGNNSGQGVSTGSYNAVVGNLAGRSLTTGNNNVFLGFEAGYSADSTSYNVFIGRESGFANNAGTFNNYVGYQAGRNVTSGRNNTFIGYQAGLSGLAASDSNNVMIGKSVGFKLTTGHDNIGIGNAAGYNITTGTYNVMIGSNAGYSNQTGRFNTIMGYQAGENTTSDYGTMIGYLAGNASTTGYSQTMIGYSAGLSNTGSYNVMVGTCAGQNSSTGNYNTYVGLAAGYYTTGDNNIFLGHWAGYGETATSDKLIIETNYTGSDNLNNALIYGDFSTNGLRFNATVGIGNAYSSSYGLMVNGGSSTVYSMVVYKGAYAYGNGFVSASDLRYKYNILEIDHPVEKLEQIKGVYFNWNKDKFRDKEFNDRRQIGVIAQEVEKVFPELVTEDEKGYKGVAYDKLGAVMIEAIKEQQKTIKNLQNENTMLKDRLDKLESSVSAILPGQK